ncbi:hypothetical protein AAFP35_26055 [Gordonia sp. CPCC 206044]|uniref:hypothetical protein n=1 Tax=Gordonia sp. CPCC 206044 TaxID=3140793 RepID=UPI003AF3F4AD
MTEPHATGPVPGPPRPGPHLMPRTAGAADPDVGDDGPDPGEVTETVAALLADVDAVREAAGDGFDAHALARQTELLERAHETLTAALEDVDRR